MRIRRKARHVGRPGRRPNRPRCSRICRAAGLSVWVVTMSAPRLSSVSVAAASFGGSNQESMNTTFSVAAGFLLLRGEQERVHAEHHFGHLVGAEIAERAGLALHAGDGAEHGAAFMEARIVDGDIVRRLEAGAVFELDVGEFRRDFQRLVHIAVGRGEDQLAALVGEVADHRGGRGVFGDVLDIDGLDLVAERCLQRLAALVMGPGPAEIADRTEEDEADLELFLGEGLAAQRGATLRLRRQPG